MKIMIFFSLFKELKIIKRQLTRKYYDVTLNLGNESTISIRDFSSVLPLITIFSNKTSLSPPLNEFLKLEEGQLNPNRFPPRDLISLVTGAHTEQEIQHYIERNPTRYNPDLTFISQRCPKDTLSLIQQGLDTAVSEIQQRNLEVIPSTYIVAKEGYLPNDILNFYSKGTIRRLESQLAEVDIAWHLAHKTFNLTSTLLQVLGLRFGLDSETLEQFSQYTQTSAEQFHRNLITLQKLQGEHLKKDMVTLNHLYQEIMEKVFPITSPKYLSQHRQS